MYQNQKMGNYRNIIIHILRIQYIDNIQLIGQFMRLLIRILLFSLFFTLGVSQIKAHPNFGGYHMVDISNLCELDVNEYADPISEARVAYRKQNKGFLGKLVELQTQVVSGLNYKMTFQVGQNKPKIQIIVNCQPWLYTCQLLSSRELNP